MYNLIVRLAFFLFIFLTFNREFRPFVDLRFLIIPIYLMVIVLSLLQFLARRRFEIYGSLKKTALFIVMVSLVILSNFKLIGTSLPMNWKVFSDASILYFFNLLTVIAFSLTYKRLTVKDFYFFVNISALFLFASMMATLAGVDIHGIFGRQARSFDPGDDFAPLGFRVAGYAEDVNYASLCMIIWLYVLVFIRDKNRLKALNIMPLFGYLIAFSKTIFVTIIYWLGFEFSRLIKLRKVYIFATFLVSGIGFYGAYILLRSLQTMRTRFHMWDVAFNAIKQNPILGLGTTGVRANFDANGGWFVQPHNNFIAIAADHGLIALGIYLFFIVKKFRLELRYYIIMIFFFLLSVTQDIWVFPYPVFILFLMPMMLEKKLGTLKNATLTF